MTREPRLDVDDDKLWMIEETRQRRRFAREAADPLNLNSSVDFSRRDAEAQRMLDICVVLSFRPKKDGFANLHLVGEKH